MRFETSYYKLDNGVRVLEIPMEGHESVTSLVLVKTGSRNEDDSQAGLSHVLEHMLFKGTEEYPEPLDLASAIESMGAQVNAFTGKEFTGYYIKASSSYLSKSLSILSQMLTKSTLRDDHLDREKGVIVEEINMYEDRPMERVGEEFENLLFSGNLGRLIIGTKDTVRQSTPDTLREYLSRWYKGSNVLVILAGGVGSSRQVVEEHFSSISEGDLDGYKSRGEYSSEKHLHIEKDTEQAHFVTGVPGISLSDPKWAALKVLQIVLGGNMSSRLFSEIREKRGLAYYVKADEERYYDAGYLSVRAGVKLDSYKEALEVVQDEMINISSDLKEEEIVMAKDYYKGVMTLSLEDSMGLSKFLGEAALLLDEVWDVGQVFGEIENVSASDVKSLASSLVSPEKFRTAVIGPSSL